MDKDILINLSNAEFDYISDVLNTLYNNLKKLPKRMRTPKFYLLENLIKNSFSKNN